MLVRRVVNFQFDFCLWQRLSQLHFWTHKRPEDHQNDSSHQYFGDHCESMPQPAERKQGEPKAHQRNDQLRILPFQPRRTMGTNKPSPRIGIEEERGSNFVRASRALRHGRFPLFALAPTVPRSLNRVNGTHDSLCRNADLTGSSLRASGTWRRASTVLCYR